MAWPQDPLPVLVELWTGSWTDITDDTRAVEGPIATVRGSRPEEIEYTGAAAGLQPLWLELRGAMRDVLEQTTLADLVARSSL